MLKKIYLGRGVCDEIMSNKNKVVDVVQNQLKDINSNNNALSESLNSCQAELSSEDRCLQ